MLTSKQQHRLAREAHRQAKHQHRVEKHPPDTQLNSQPLDCACVIHGSVYDWSYVDKLYNMLSRHLTRPVRLHVYTEESRAVPSTYVKHSLIDWGFKGPKKAWWYKVQLFNKQHHSGAMLYFDLDTVIVENIDWVWQHDLKHFWAIRDFKHLWRPTHLGINSSIMWWDTEKYDWIWQAVAQNDIGFLAKKYHGDQDFITAQLGPNSTRFFDVARVKSWRWQALDGGYDFKRRTWRTPGSGTAFDNKTSILVFHGNPKPHEVTDKIVQSFWQ